VSLINLNGVYIRCSVFSIVQASERLLQRPRLDSGMWQLLS